MASEQVPTSAPASSPAPAEFLKAWLERIGLSGKLLAFGGLAGVLAVFLPLLTVSVHIPDGANLLGGKGGVIIPASQSTMVVSTSRGILCLLGYVAAIALAYVLYPPTGLAQKTLAWAGAGLGAVIALLALWLLIDASRGTFGVAGLASMQVSIGLGAILNLLTGAAVAAGGFLKAREEKLI